MSTFALLLTFAATPTLAWSSESLTCSHCDGTGWVLAVEPCPTCNQSGKVDDNVCDSCGGTGYVSNLVDCPECDSGHVLAEDDSPQQVVVSDGALDPVTSRLDDLQKLLIATVSLIAAVLGAVAFQHFWVDLSK